MRLGVPVLLAVSCGAATVVSLRASDIPTIAFGSHVVLALQLALVFFYGALLLLVPVIRALSDGDLPIELSLRGARWTEELRDVGGDVAIRQLDLTEEGLSADVDVKQEISALREELRNSEEAQEKILNRALERVAAIETKVMNSESRS